MSDLMKCLYDFVQDRRMGSVYEDPEYEEVSRSVELQLDGIQQALSAQQYKELLRLLENISAQNSIECEHLFQASLELAWELRRVAVKA